MSSEKVRGIELKIEMQGNGIVNFDGLDDQKELWNNMVYRNGFGTPINANNYTPGKALYEPQKDGKVLRYPMVSSYCIRQAMYAEEMSQQMPAIIYNDELIKNKAAHHATIERGDLKIEKWIKRKSSFSVTNAVCKANEHGVCPLSQLETHSNSEPKNGTLKEGKGQDSTSESNYFHKETRGKLFYLADGYIDTREMPFISFSDMHDRLYCNPDWIPYIIEKMSKRIGSQIPSPQFYNKEFDISSIPEYGILLTPEQNKFLVKDILRRIARIYRTSANAWLKSTRIELRFIFDPIDHTTIHSESEWIVVKNEECKFDTSCIDNVDFSVGYIADENQQGALEIVNSIKEKSKEANAKDNERNQKIRERKEKTIAEKKAALEAKKLSEAK